MSAPLYFFAGRTRNDLVDPATRRFRAAPLASAGLSETWRDVVDVDAQCALVDLTARGPGGKSGLMVVALPPSREPPKRLGYYAEFQRWLQVGDDVWIGADREQPPTADDLRRETKLHGGYELELACGLWTVPVVRRPPAAIERGFAASDLPHDIGWNLAGQFAKSLKIDYQQLWDDTAELCGVFFGDAEGKARQITVERGLRWAIRLLALNYRFGAHEQNLLHVVDADSVFLILGAAVDYLLARRLLDEQKKSAPAETPPPSNTPPGSPGGCPGTGPAAASCGSPP